MLSFQYFIVAIPTSMPIAIKMPSIGILIWTEKFEDVHIFDSKEPCFWQTWQSKLTNRTIYKQIFCK